MNKRIDIRDWLKHLNIQQLRSMFTIKTCYIRSHHAIMCLYGARDA